MPGRHLSDPERHLLARWDHAALGEITLKSIEVAGGSGIRGVTDVIIPFRYPITAICGRNGVGKSTILSLAALAHHSPKDWYVPRANTQQRRHVSVDRSYYTFGDFFVRGQNDSAIEDVSVTWRFDRGGAEETVRFSNVTNQLGSYKRRPERAVGYLPLSRLAPANELSGLRAAFANPTGAATTATLTATAREHLSFIMDRNYAVAEVQERRRYALQGATVGTPYTGFNMGGGESCMITLLDLLYRLPAGGLLVAEEMEAGLHPQAQVRLAQVLVRVCQERRIQIVCTTHSETFIDSLPRQARLLLRRHADEHSVLEAPSTRFAIYEMTGVAQPELMIYCEDRAAVALIKQSLPENLRLRVDIRDVGSAQTVIRQGVSHIRSGYPMMVICVLDGDQTEEAIERWLASETAGQNEWRPDYLTLPGGQPPERWLASQLQEAPYLERFAERFGCTVAQAGAHIESLNVLQNHHDIVHVLSQLTNLEELDCLQRAIHCVAPDHPELDAVRTRIQEMLN